jgi:mRNA interferase YafQ
MYTIVATNQFKKDFKLCIKRSFKTDLIEVVIFSLEQDGTLPCNSKPHLLKNNCKGSQKCHIQLDWLLIWQQEDEIKLFSHTKTDIHSDLF